MRKIIVAGMIFLLLIVILGCTVPPTETGVQPSAEQPALQTEQQILEEYPDNLEQALEELDLIE